MSDSQESPALPSHSLGFVIGVIGLLALTVGLVGEFSGVFSLLEFEIQRWIMGSSEFGERMASVPAWFRFSYCAGAAFLTPATLLAIDGRWRRVLCWMVAAFLTLSLSLVLLLFELWFSPLTALLTGLWAGLGSFYHLSHLARSSQVDAPASSRATEVEEVIAPKEQAPVADLDEDDEWKEFRAKK